MNIRLSRIGFLFFAFILAFGMPGLVGRVVFAHPATQEGDPEPPPTPVINIWYGNTQSFGNFGNPQPQVTILGDVDNATSLEYTLNGGEPQPLTIGPDGRRLQGEGDFVIELFDVDLLSSNSVVITAKNDNGEAVATATKNLTINYRRDVRTALPFSISTWPATSSLSTVAQVLDGYWYKPSTSTKIAIEDPGYDRLLAIGDMSWQDYEVLSEITVLTKDEIHCSGEELNDCGPNSGSPGVGLILRWQGHSDKPISGQQPKSGWLPLGAIGWFRWNDDPAYNSVRIYHDDQTTEYGPASNFVFGEPYMFRFRVATQADGRPLYSLKVWPKAAPEPLDWSVQSFGRQTDPKSGSVVLFAHHVRAEFGPITVTKLGEQPPATIVSEDFNTCALDSNVWEFYTPVNQGLATASITGAYSGNSRLNITVPGGLPTDNHPEKSNNKAARLRQSVNNGNFQVEAKFDSAVSSQYQMQGIMVEEGDPNNFIRFEYFSTISGTYIYVHAFRGTIEQEFLYEKISPAPVSPLYMRVLRKGDHWVVLHSLNGITWSTKASFPYLFDLKKIGVYAGNAFQPSAPAHTAVVDYFWDINNPIALEDGAQNTLTITAGAGGNVNKSPDKGTYACGESVQISASPNPGYSFSNWSGGLTGSVNPATVVMNGPKVINANFTQDTYTLTVNVIGNGSVARSDPGPYHYGDIITLTAVPNPGFDFEHWSGAVSSTEMVIEVEIKGNTSVTAHFSGERQVFLPLVIK